MPIRNLFSMYRLSYAKEVPDDVAGHAPMREEELAQTARNEFLLPDGFDVKLKKRGDNFYHRSVCWLVERVFSRIGIMPGNRTRRRAAEEFATAVASALADIGVEDPDSHRTVKMIRDHGAKNLPLRSNFVRAVLGEVSDLGYAQSPEIWEHTVPEFALNAFGPPPEDEDSEPPSYDQIGGILPTEDPPAYEEPPVNDEPLIDLELPAYSEVVPDRGTRP